MIKVSDLLSKQLICLDKASVEGTVGNILFDARMQKGCYLELFCEDESDPEIKYVELKHVTAQSEDACVVKYAHQVLCEWNRTNECVINPINCLCYNQDGKNLGKLTDILLQGVMVKKLILTDGEFAPKDLLSYSNKLLIFNDTGKPYKLTKASPKMPEAMVNAPILLHAEKENLSSYTLNGYPQITTGTPPDAPTNAKSPIVEIELPKKMQSAEPTLGTFEGYKFLLGKPVRTDITRSDGSVLIPAGQVVSEDIIKVAHINGKLVQLALRAY